jgi:hypothetical protein
MNITPNNIFLIKRHSCFFANNNANNIKPKYLEKKIII